MNAGKAKVGSGLLSKLIGRITNCKEDILQLQKYLKPSMIIPVHWGTFSHYSEMLKAEDFSYNDTIKLLTVGEVKIL